MSPIKIAYVLTPIDFGGAERVSLTFIKNVNRNEFDINPILLIRPWEGDNFFIRSLKTEGYNLFTVPVAIKPRSEGRDYFRVLRCFKIIHSILKAGSFDLVHTHGYFADIVGIPAAKMLNIPIISTCHGFISNDVNLKFYNKLDRYLLRYTDRIIAVSDGIKNDLIGNGIKESKIELIHNAVDQNGSKDMFLEVRKAKRELFRMHESQFIVGYIGRLSEEKGIKYLIEAYRLLIKEGALAKILIIGDGPQKKELEVLAKKTGNGDNIIFAGFQTNIENWLPAMDVFVLPSLTEGTPMALLEAMAGGLPVVASAVGGVPQVINAGKNGLLVSPGKPEEIKSAVLTLYRNKTLRESISRAAEDTIREKYNARQWAGKIEAQYLSKIHQSK